MSTCPGVELLLAGGGADHARTCEQCRALRELIAARVPDGCGLAEALLAAQVAGVLAPDSERLLALHLDLCEACRQVAESLE